MWHEDSSPLLSVEENTVTLLIRTVLSEREKLHKIFPDGIEAECNGELGFITPEGAEAEIREKLRNSEVEVRATWRIMKV